MGIGRHSSAFPSVYSFWLSTRCSQGYLVVSIDYKLISLILLSVCAVQWSEIILSWAILTKLQHKILQHGYKTLIGVKMIYLCVQLDRFWWKCTKFNSCLFLKDCILINSSSGAISSQTLVLLGLPYRFCHIFCPRIDRITCLKGRLALKDPCWSNGAVSIQIQENSASRFQLLLTCLFKVSFAVFRVSKLSFNRLFSLSFSRISWSNFFISALFSCWY